MDKYKKYYGIGIFVLTAFVLIYGAYSFISPKINELTSTNSELIKKQTELNSKRNEKNVVQNKIKKIKDSIVTSQKKLYAPTESDLGQDSLFFTLYNDVIEMIQGNSIKIKAINYVYNPAEDEFVKFGKDIYFVCDINLELISNYVNLGKLIQDLYQYPYYIKINSLEVKPYTKDKKVLISNLSIRIYTHTEPKEPTDINQ